MRLLLVEDDPVFRRFALASLSEPMRLGGHPIQATTVGSLRDALEALAIQRPDCVLLDLGLPDSSGLQTLAAVTEAAPGLPVVVLTGTEEDQLADQALLAGAQDFLEKDQLEPRSLARALRHALDRGEWAGQINAKNQELESRNRDLDDFAHAVSHDLKAPLRALFNLLTEAREQLDGQDVPGAQATLSSMEPRIRRLFGMIDGLLRMTSAGRPADPVPIDVGAVVREVLDNLAVPPMFDIHIQAGPVRLTGDKAALAQVLQNLIDNAIKHHPRMDGRIDVAWRSVDGAVEFVVADDGAGIPSESRESVFQMFRTLGAPGSTSGIGLALVRKVVQAQGGTVVAEANEPRGTRFRFTWPEGVAAPPTASTQTVVQEP